MTGSLPSSELLVQCMTGPNWAPFVSVSDILACLALSRSCLYDQMGEGLLPSFVKFGARKANWPLVVLEALIQNRMEVREGMTHLRQPIQLPHWSTWCPHLPPTERDSGLDDLQSLQLLGVEEVADRLGVSVSTVYRFVRLRGLPGPIPLTPEGASVDRLGGHAMDEFVCRSIIADLGELPREPRDVRTAAQYPRIVLGAEVSTHVISVASATLARVASRTGRAVRMRRPRRSAPPDAVGRGVSSHPVRWCSLLPCRWR